MFLASTALFFISVIILSAWNASSAPSIPPRTTSRGLVRSRSLPNLVIDYQNESPFSFAPTSSEDNYAFVDDDLSKSLHEGVKITSSEDDNEEDDYEEDDDEYDASGYGDMEIIEHSIYEDDRVYNGDQGYNSDDDDANDNDNDDDDDDEEEEDEDDDEAVSECYCEYAEEDHLDFEGNVQKDCGYCGGYCSSDDCCNYPSCDL